MSDLWALDRSRLFVGRYHVLGGRLSALDGIGPEHLRLQALVERIQRDGIREIILATNPSVQGESTALLIMRMVRELPVRVSRIAQGVPVGGDLKYIDRMTLAKSLEFRRRM